MENPLFDCLIIGSGPAGLSAGNILKALGYKICILEKESIPGGKLNLYNELFPCHESATGVLKKMLEPVDSHIRTSIDISGISKTDEGYVVKDKLGFEFRSLTLLLTTGFTPFNARRKEEYGYGIFKNVITSIELESRLKTNKLFTPSGKIPESVAFIHCVGSRDIRVGNEFCSANCCITGIKQAISIKKLIPDVNVFCLYMDLRLGGRYYEDYYKSSQTDYKIRFIRGRLSEASENQDLSISLKYEDTLAGKPARNTVDLLVLLVGIQANHSLMNIKSDLDLIPGTDGFFGDANINAGLDETDNRLFFAGCSTGPKSIPQTTADASEVAFRIHQYFQKKLNKEKQVKYDRLRLRNS